MKNIVSYIGAIALALVSIESDAFPKYHKHYQDYSIRIQEPTLAPKLEENKLEYILKQDDTRFIELRLDFEINPKKIPEIKKPVLKPIPLPESELEKLN